jgi:hypothetical protein
MSEKARINVSITVDMNLLFIGGLVKFCVSKFAHALGFDLAMGGAPSARAHSLSAQSEAVTDSKMI